MSELFFALKCLVFTFLIMLLLQTKISGVTLETRAEQFIKRSGISSYLQDASAGGASLAQDAYYTTKKFVLDSTRSFRSSETQDSRASRR